MTDFFVTVVGGLLLPSNSAASSSKLPRSRPRSAPVRIAVSVSDVVAPITVFDRDDSLSAAFARTSSTSMITARNRTSR